MIELHTLANALPGWLVSMTLWSGGILLGVAVVDRLLREQVAPAWRVALYLAVFARVALPLDWTSPLGLFGGEAESASPLAASSASVGLVAPEAPTLLGLPEAEVGAALSNATASASPSLGWAGLAFLVYLAGALGLVVWMQLARRRVRDTLGHARPARASVASLAPQRRVLEHDDLGPLAFGVLDPVIVLPRRLADSLSHEELRCVMAHEEAHLDRKDPALAWALSVATALLWPLLPVWLATARIRHLMELAADEAAVAKTAPRVYGETLIKLADQQPEGTPKLAMAAGLHLGNFFQLRGRVASLHRRAALPRLLQPLAAFGIAAAAVACSGLQGGAGDAESLTQRCEGLKQNATTLHDRAEKSQDSATALEAASLYDEYVDRCQADPDYGEVVYYAGELLWSQASAAHARGDKAAAEALFAEAHTTFRAALAADPGRFEKDAAYAQLLAKRNELGDRYQLPERKAEPCDGCEVKGGKAEGFPRTEYSAEEEQMLEALITYEAHNDDPSDEALQQVYFERAKLAMTHNRFDEAEPVLRKLFATPGASDYHVWGAEMLTDLLTIAWVDAQRSPEERRRAGEALGAWLEELEASGRLELETAEALRAAADKLKAAL